MMITSATKSAVEGDPSVLDIERLTGNIGAIVHGIRLGPDLPPETVEALRDAVHRYKVIFFRRQHHLDDAAQEGFAGLLGEVSAHPNAPVIDGTRSVWALDTDDGVKSNAWHTDLGFQPEVCYLAVLRAVLLPPVGGDTLWANTAAAYRKLPGPLRALVDSARARYNNLHDYMPERADYKMREGYTRSGKTREIETDHPLVHVIPETGERALLMGQFFRNFIGMTEAESLSLYFQLQSYITRPEHVVRWRWAPGDVAMWDNRATQHYGVNDYTEHRILHRVALKGRPLRGIDGRESFILRDEVK